jgi:colicin import membrane protein
MKRCFIAMVCGLAGLAAWAEDFPTPEERQATSERLTEQRDAIERDYKQALKDCYQRFDVNACRSQARERRIAADKALRPEELAHKAMERRVRAEEARQRLEEKTSDAKQKEDAARRAQALEARQQRADAAEQKQIEHELKGTHRGEYEARLRQAQEHRANVEKRLRERGKPPAAPLPVPGASY